MVGKQELTQRTTSQNQNQTKISPPPPPHILEQTKILQQQLPP